MEIEDKIVLKKEREKTGIILDSYEEWKEKNRKQILNAGLAEWQR